MEINQKQQTEVAKDLGFNATTLNMWCNGKSFPSTGKIRKLADYFGIGMSDLTDKRNSSDDNNIKYSDACMKIGLNDERLSLSIMRCLWQESNCFVISLKSLSFKKSGVISPLFLH